MIAYDTRWPGDPAPRFSEEVRALLVEALTEEWGAAEGDRGKIHLAVAAAAREASERGLPPESLILELKRLERSLFSREVLLDEQRRFHDWLVATCLRAYYRGP